MPPDLSHRLRTAEWMDAPDASEAELRRSLRFIRRVNRSLGYTRATLHHLKRFAERWPRGRAVRIVDLATGSADIPVAILDWAERRGHDVQVVGVEWQPTTARIAAEARHPRLSIVRSDARRLPFADGSFDYAITSMFLHHLSEADIVRVMREMDRVATRGIVVADLIRNRRAYAWITLFTLLAKPMVRHDARASVRQAFTRDEILACRDRAGVGYAVFHRQFGYRFVLAGERADGAAARSKGLAAAAEGGGSENRDLRSRVSQSQISNLTYSTADLPAIPR